MTSPPIGEQQFHDEVYPAELEAIRQRRASTREPRRSADAGDAPPPDVEHGLVGLAFSGGGIRSASFSLGVTQVLIRKGLFERVDYLSTVSLAYTGDEPEYLRSYRRRSPRFPHESTGNQFYGEAQFEVYRALGTHTALGALEDLSDALPGAAATARAPDGVRAPSSAARSPS